MTNQCLLFLGFLHFINLPLELSNIFPTSLLPKHKQHKQQQTHNKLLRDTTTHSLQYGLFHVDLFLVACLEARGQGSEGARGSDLTHGVTDHSLQELSISLQFQQVLLY